jgi:hypothetical protein
VKKTRMGLVTAIPTKRNSVVISIAQKAAKMSERLLKALRKPRDFRAEHSVTVAVTFQWPSLANVGLGGCASSLSREEKEQRLFVFRGRRKGLNVLAAIDVDLGAVDV